MPFDNMGVITMKIISSTSMTSTSGVTLISDTAAGALGLWAMLPSPAAALQEVINQLGRRVVHLHVEGLDLAGEVVVDPDGRDGDEEANGGRDQSFRNTARHSAQAGRLLL